MSELLSTPGPSRPVVLAAENLSVAYGTRRVVEVVSDVSFSVRQGEALGIVGESGCGKSQTMLALLRLLPKGGRIVSGGVIFEGRDLVRLSQTEMRTVRGRGIALISQDALSALNPSKTVGAQMSEPLVVNEGMSSAAARQRCIELLDLVGIPGAARRLSAYPHELSGGMRQRVLIAMAVSCNPKVLIADEPTTALDVTIQSQILELIDRLRRDLGMAVLLITHDLGVVAGVTDSIAIMYAGRIVELGTTVEIFEAPRHPYTNALLGAVPPLDGPVEKRLRPIPGVPPDPRRPIKGCAFQPRCGYARDICGESLPPLAALADRPCHSSRCRVDPAGGKPGGFACAEGCA